MPETQPASLSALGVSGVYRDTGSSQTSWSYSKPVVRESLGLLEFLRIIVAGRDRVLYSVFLVLKFCRLVLAGVYAPIAEAAQRPCEELTG